MECETNVSEHGGRSAGTLKFVASEYRRLSRVLQPNGVNGLGARVRKAFAALTGQDALPFLGESQVPQGAAYAVKGVGLLYVGREEVLLDTPPNRVEAHAFFAERVNEYLASTDARVYWALK